MGKPVLGYWDIRGLAQTTRLLLQYLGVDYVDKRYSHGSGPTPSDAEWLAEKFTLGLDFPNVPYWIDDKIKLTESAAILKYVAKTRGPETVPDNAEDQAVADMIEGVAGDVQLALVNVAYSKTGIPDSPLEVELAKKFEYLEKFLSNRKWVVGDKITYVDFILYEVLFEFLRYNKDFLKPYPALENYVNAFESLPQLTEYIKTSSHLICYSAYATLQF
jgi:glutathione S-transferase